VIAVEMGDENAFEIRQLESTDPGSRRSDRSANDAGTGIYYIRGAVDYDRDGGAGFVGVGGRIAGAKKDDLRFGGIGFYLGSGTYRQEQADN
jgi:hypothetical protein